VGSALIDRVTDVVGHETQAMTEKPEHGKDEHRTRKSVWGDAKIVVNIEHTKPGTALDDYLRKEQTRATRSVGRLCAEAR
jgi:hypothetical protein